MSAHRFSKSPSALRSALGLIIQKKRGLLIQHQGAEVGVLGTGIEPRTVFVYPGQVTVTEDLGFGIVVKQTAEQGLHRVLLGRCAGVVGLAFLINTAFVADAYRMGVVATGVSTHLFLRATAVYLTVLRDVVVIADALEPSGQVTNFEILQREVLCGFRR